jgi:site-specific DNA recombinase
MHSAAVILARVSSKSQEDEGYSLDSQVKLLQTYCDGHELHVIRTYKIAESASKSVQRRIFKGAMDYIEEQGIKHLIIEKVDRHVRNLQDAVETHDWLMADENKRVHFVKDSLVMHKNSRSQEWLNWGIRVVMAKNYIDNLREEAMKGWAEKLAQGWLPAPPPPGYMTVTQNGKRIHVPNPKNSKLMKQVLELDVEHNQSINTISLEMARRGLVSRNGRPIVKSHVQKILMNPFYIGINRFDGKDYPGAQQTLISKKTYDQIQLKLHGKTPIVSKRHNPIMKNMITCEDCGGLITWQQQKGRYYGSCQQKSNKCKHRKYLREDKVEELVMERLKALVSPSQEIIDWVAQEMRHEQQNIIEQQEAAMAAIQVQIDRIERMDTMLYDDKLAGDITKEVYDVKHQQFTDQKSNLQEQYDSATTEHTTGLEKKLVLLKLSQKAANIYAKRTVEQKRLIITELFESMTSKDTSVSVKYTKLSEAISQNVIKTKQIIGG